MKTRKGYGAGTVFPELLSNSPGHEVTIRIDSNLLAQAESEDPNTPRKDAAEQLRHCSTTDQQKRDGCGRDVNEYSLSLEE